MNYVLAAAWFVIAAGWFSGIALIAKMIGGFQYIEHMGQTRVTLMLGLAGVLCVAAGFAALRRVRLPRLLSLSIVAVTALHLINAIGMYILFSTNGRAGPVMLPFMWLSMLLPTTTMFMGMPPGNVSLFMLPGATLVAWGFSLAMPGRRARNGDD